MIKSLRGALAAILLGLSACPAAAGAIRNVIVIAMENTDAGDIYGNTGEAPFINSVVIPQAARAGNFADLLGLSARSEPHYVMMEAGTRSFADHTFSTNDDPSARNSTGSLAHLTRQLRNKAISWMSYQQSMGSATGACPITTQGNYAAKHNPFVFFRDISGSPPSRDNAYCASHHRPYSAFAADLAAGQLARYVFISPDLCHDMHDTCRSSSRIRAGDDWLKAELPAMVTWADANAGVIFIVWDEGRNTGKMPFFALGPGVKPGFAYDGKLSHRALLKGIEQIFGLPLLGSVADAPGMSGLFAAGRFP